MVLISLLITLVLLLTISCIFSLNVSGAIFNMKNGDHQIKLGFAFCASFLTNQRCQKMPIELTFLHFQTRVSSKIAAWFLPLALQLSVFKTSSEVQPVNFRFSSQHYKSDRPIKAKVAISFDFSRISNSTSSKTTGSRSFLNNLIDGL